MVKLIVYIEGPPEVPGADSSVLFREGFNRLLSQKFPNQDFNLVIQSIGSVTQTKIYLKKIIDENIEGVLLIDLETSKSNKDEKLNNYSPLDTSRIYFMIQEMEAWILSQPEKIEIYGEQENYKRKNPIAIAENALLKNKHPEDIEKPSEKLNTILSQTFEIIKERHGKQKKAPKRYKKTYDGPNLIAILDLDNLESTFEDVKSMVSYIEAKKYK
ncbi:MAG: DUF4276 family protein [Bacteroidia bacterium]